MTSAFEPGLQCPPGRDSSQLQISILFPAACLECKAGFLGILGLSVVLGGDSRYKSLKEPGTDPERLRTEAQGLCLAPVMTGPDSSHILV